MDGKGQGASWPTLAQSTWCTWVWSKDPWAGAFWERKRKQVEGSFILGIARVRRPSRVIGRVAATALGVFQMRQGSGVEGDLGPFLCILRLGRW